jgi:hypothetical protein
MTNWEGCGRKRSWSTLRYYPGMSGGTEEKQEKFSQDSRSVDPDMDSGPPKYEAGVITTLSRRSLPRYSL